MRVLKAFFLGQRKGDWESFQKGGSSPTAVVRILDSGVYFCSSPTENLPEGWEGRATPFLTGMVDSLHSSSPVAWDDCPGQLGGKLW